MTSTHTRSACAMGKNIERAIRGSLEQGLLREPLRLEDIYYRTTLTT
jgi:hypothetical protein